MRRLVATILPLLLLFTACKTEKKYLHYATLYSEAPQTVYIAPLFDLTTRRADADSALTEEYKMQDAVCRNFVTTLPIGLHQRAYTAQRNDTILRPNAINARRLVALQNNDLGSYCATKDADAVLITSLLRWGTKRTEPAVYVEYQLRSTKTGLDLMHAWVKISRTVDTTYNGQLITLQDEQRLADTLGVTPECAIRCLMVQRTNILLMQDLPFTPRSNYYDRDRYLHSMPRYFKVGYTNEGSPEIESMTTEAFENEAFL